MILSKRPYPRMYHILYDENLVELLFMANLEYKTSTLILS